MYPSVRILFVPSALKGNNGSISASKWLLSHTGDMLQYALLFAIAAETLDTMDAVNLCEETPPWRNLWMASKMAPRSLVHHVNLQLNTYHTQI
jgi:hypothetical protein